MELLNARYRISLPLRVGPGEGRKKLACAPVVLLTLFAGCQAPHAPSETPPPKTGSAELVMYLADEPFVTAEPAYRAIYALAQGEAFTGDFDTLAGQLRADNLIGKYWNYGADRCLDRAAVAFMVCRACKIQSGVNCMLTGLGRYAWRELQFKGIAEGGSETALMSGGEFVGLLSRAEEYLQRTGTTGEQTVELGKPDRAR